MKVAELKAKYESLQKEGNEIYAEIRPLLKRLKALSKKCMKLGDKADNDKGLYEDFRRVLGENAGGNEIVAMSRCPNGWDTAILFRLWDFECLVNDPNNSAIDAIDNVLFNLKHTKFTTKKGDR